MFFFVNYRLKYSYTFTGEESENSNPNAPRNRQPTGQLPKAHVTQLCSQALSKACQVLSGLYQTDEKFITIKRFQLRGLPM